MQNLDETIAAIVTPLGVGGVAVIRISGPLSFEIGKILSRKTNLIFNHSYHVWLPNNIDEVVLTFFKSPNSFTGEDTLEISCHGGTNVAQNILSLVLHSGARLAKNGEFSMRAFLNGKIDLVQAEAINSMIISKTNELSEVSAFQLKGGLSKHILELQNRCLNLLTMLQADIDFPDDNLTQKSPKNEITSLISSIDSIVETAKYGLVLRDGITVVIAGKPNVGKSSLLNALLKNERAIVTEIPGTTRDAIIEAVNIKGLIVKLIDTAGIRSSCEPIEVKGVELSKRLIDSSDVVLLVLDGSKVFDSQDLEVATVVGDKRCITLLNKSDIARGNEHSGIRVSAKTGQGLEELEKAIFDLVLDDQRTRDSFVVTSERQLERLKSANISLHNALEAARIDVGSELISIEVQSAVESLGEMLGINVGDKVLNKIFSEFCVGK